jgi:outer membrane lipoprotein-sorting protein
MNRRLALPAVLAVALVAASGCSALPALDGGDADGPPSPDAVADGFEAIESLAATQVSTLSSGANETRTRAVVAIAVENGTVRQYSRTLEPESRAGNRVVTRENATLVYDAAENTVTRVSNTGDRRTLADQRSFYARVAAAAANNSTVEPPSRGVSPLPVVPAAPNPGAVDEDRITGYQVEYLGTDGVAGRTAHGFEIAAVTDAAVDVEQTLWLDAEFFYPLKQSRTSAFGNETYEVTTRLENVTFNEALPADTVEWSPPEDATVDSVSIPRETYGDRGALAAAAPLAVPDPAVPDGYTFQQGTVVDDENITQVSVEYATGSGTDAATISVTRLGVEGTDGAAGRRLSFGENVTIGDHNGTYVVNSRSKLVAWSCGETRLSVTATDLDREQLLVVAESLACG